MGQSTAIGVGGDPVVGLYYKELLTMFENDPETDSIALIGEIGGDAEEQAAEFIRKHITKPVAVFIAGQSAPPGKQMGHAGLLSLVVVELLLKKLLLSKKLEFQWQEPSEIPMLLKRKDKNTLLCIRVSEL